MVILFGGVENLLWKRLLYYVKRLLQLVQERAANLSEMCFLEADSMLWTRLDE